MACVFPHWTFEVEDHSREPLKIQPKNPAKSTCLVRVSEEEAGRIEANARGSFLVLSGK